jgi:hypothetical protein
MYQFNNIVDVLIQGFVVVIIIGVFYNLIVTTKAYGGIIGKAIRLLGVGILFIAMASIERALINFSIIQTSQNIMIVQDVLLLLGLIFAGLGFSKLASGTKA